MMLVKSSEKLAEGRRFELRNPVRGHGFQDDSAVIPNPSSFLSSRRVRSLATLFDVGPSGVLVDAHGHRMGTPEENKTRVGCPRLGAPFDPLIKSNPRIVSAEVHDDVKLEDLLGVTSYGMGRAAW
jgi:hypothetical protein